MNPNCILEVAPFKPPDGKGSMGRRLFPGKDSFAGKPRYAYLLGVLAHTALLAPGDGEGPETGQECRCPERREGKRRHRILIIEDDPASVQLYSYLLGAFGYQTLVAADGVDGLDIARREQPDLIICDIQLPGLDGVKLMQELKGDPFLRRVPIIAVTAYAMVGDRERLLRAGFDGYIPKPIVPEIFVEQIKNFLDRVKGFLH